MRIVENCRLNQVAFDTDVQNWYETERVYNVEGGFVPFGYEEEKTEEVITRASRSAASVLRRWADSLEQVGGNKLQVHGA